jgi:hypothetical protein
MYLIRTVVGMKLTGIELLDDAEFETREEAAAALDSYIDSLGREQQAHEYGRLEIVAA